MPHLLQSFTWLVIPLFAFLFWFGFFLFTIFLCLQKITKNLATIHITKVETITMDTRTTTMPSEYRVLLSIRLSDHLHFTFVLLPIAKFSRLRNWFWLNASISSSRSQYSYSDDTPLIRDEFLNEAPIGPHDLGAEPILGVAIDEFESWTPSVPKEVVKSLKDKQVKRQEHIYEFIMTEKTHCQTLLVMQKVFVDSLQRHFSHRKLERMFPRLQELTELHIGWDYCCSYFTSSHANEPSIVIRFLKKLRLKQRENHIIDSIADILVEFFSASSAQKLKSAYGKWRVKLQFHESDCLRSVSDENKRQSPRFRCADEFSWKFPPNGRRGSTFV